MRVEQSRRVPEAGYHTQYEMNGLVCGQLVDWIQNCIHEAMAPLLQDLRNYVQVGQQRLEREREQQKLLAAVLDRQTRILVQQTRILNQHGAEVKALKKALEDKRGRMAEQRTQKFHRPGDSAWFAPSQKCNNSVLDECL